LAVAAPHLADLVIVPSRATADEVMRLTKARAAKVEIVPYSARAGMAPASRRNVEEVAAAYGLANHSYVLTVGTLEPRKNHIRLIEAFEHTIRAKTIPEDTQLVIAGSVGWRAQPILARIEASSERSRIHHLGYVPAAHLEPLMTGSAAFVYPSLYEGFGLPILEAMACGASVVTSDRSSLPEVAGDAGTLVDPYDAKDIARGIADAVHARMNDRSATESASVARAAQFSWHRTATSAVSLYRALLK
jgi:glycosyltransferase involved in cell wall biosynthesis